MGYSAPSNPASPLAPSSPGASAPIRLVGGEVSGVPTTGTWRVGDAVITQDGNVFVCTIAGTPGTWARGIDYLYASNIPPALSAAGVAGTSFTFARDNHTHPNTGLALATAGRLETVSAQATANGAVAINLANGNVFDLTLTGNVTSVALSGATTAKACFFTVKLTQDATGSRTAVWGAAWKWAAGTAPVLSTLAGSVDVIDAVSLDGGATIDAWVVGKAFA